MELDLCLVVQGMLAMITIGKTRVIPSISFCGGTEPAEL